MSKDPRGRPLHCSFQLGKKRPKRTRRKARKLNINAVEVIVPLSPHPPL